MVEIKVRLSFIVPGAVLLTKEVCESDPKENYNYQKIMVETAPKKKGQKPIKKVLNFKTRKAKPAKQAISISKEAYDYMTSREGIPTKEGNVKKSTINPSVWFAMKPEERLAVHMKLTAESFGGTKPEWEVLDD